MPRKPRKATTGKQAARKPAGKKAARKPAGKRVPAVVKIAEPLNLSLQHGPRWRWLLAREYVACGTEDIQDAAVSYAAAFIRELNAVSADISLALKSRVLTRFDSLKGKFTDLYEAYHLYNNTQVLRYATEALLLTTEPLQAVAVGAGITLDQLMLYKTFFYDIDRILTSPALVANHLLGAGRDVSVRVDNMDTQWKAVAFFGGADVFKNYMAVGAVPKTVVAQLDDMIRGERRRRALNASLVQKIDAYTATDVLRDYSQERVSEMTIGGGDAAINATFTKLVDTVGDLKARRMPVLESGGYKAVDAGFSETGETTLPDKAECDTIAQNLKK